MTCNVRISELRIQASCGLVPLYNYKPSFLFIFLSFSPDFPFFVALDSWLSDHASLSLSPYSWIMRLDFNVS